MIGRRVLGVVLALACIAALVVGGLFLFRPAEAELAGDVTAGVVPDQPNPPDAAWSKPRSQLFPGLVPNAQVSYIEPGRTDAQYAAHLLATTSDKSGRSQLISINLIDGSVRWRVSASTPFRCAERMVRGGVVCLFDSQLRILTLDNGNVARTFSAHITSRAVTVVNDHLVALSGSAINAKQASVNLQSFAPTGELEWSATHITAGLNFGLSRSGALIEVTGVTRTDGTPIVHQAADGTVVPLPAGAATLLPRDRIAVSVGGATKVFDRFGAPAGEFTGRPALVWPRDRALDGLPLFTLTPEPGTKQGQLAAHAEDGKQLWSRAVRTSLYLGYCSAHLVVRDATQLTVLGAADGKQAWTQQATSMQPVWCDGARVITLVDAVTLAAFRIDSGDEQWRVRLGTGAAAPRIMATTQGFLAVGATWFMYK